MLFTIGDVKTVARKVWPSAVEFNVQLVTATGASTEGYRVTAFGDRRRILGRLMAPTLNQLKAELEQQLKSRKLAQGDSFADPHPAANVPTSGLAAVNPNSGPTALQVHASESAN